MREQLREEITRIKQQGGDAKDMQRRLIEIDKIPKKKKTPRVVTP